MQYRSVPSGDDRGQVGIGTLIVFIALVLVAAVAAGVLVETAGELESRASDTGHDAQSQVSNHLQVTSATGDVYASPYGPYVELVNFTVTESPGAEPIDLSDMTIQVVAANGTQTATYESTATASSPGPNEFLTRTINGDGSEVLERGETIVIWLNVKYDPGPGESALVKFVDRSGATTIYEVDVPDVLVDREYVTV